MAKGIKYSTQINMQVPPTEDNHVIRKQDTSEFVTTTNDTVNTLNYTDDINETMNIGEMRFVNDPSVDVEPPPAPFDAMLLINSPETDKVLTANSNGQAIESELYLKDIAVKQNGFLLRLSRTFTTTINSGTVYNLLNGYTIPNNVLLSANVNLSDWALNSGALSFPAFDGYTAYTIDVRLYGTIGGGAGTVTELAVQLRRQADNTIVARRGVIKVNNVLEAKAISFDTYTLDTTDPFIAGGVRIEINNDSGASVNLTQADIVIKGNRH